MPNPKDIILRASAASTTGGTGAVLDVEGRTYTEVMLDVTAIASGTTLEVTIESSPTQSSWLQVGFFRKVTTQGARNLVVPDGHRYLRAVWTLSGSSPSATFVVTATAHQLYASPKDLALSGVSKSVLDGMTVLEQATACLVASSEAEGYLANATTLPITSLDAATRTHIARMAVFETQRAKGNIGKENTGVFEIGRSDALKWLGGISSGKVRPPGLVDATPDVAETGTGSGDLFVISVPRRGW